MKTNIRSIEFLGLPGSGKSTLVDNLSILLRKTQPELRVSNFRQIADHYRDESIVDFQSSFLKFRSISDHVIFHRNKIFFLINKFQKIYPNFFEFINYSYSAMDLNFYHNKRIRSWLQAEAVAYIRWIDYISLSRRKNLLLADEAFLQRSLYFGNKYGKNKWLDFMKNSPTFDLTIILKPNLDLAMQRRKDQRSPLSFNQSYSSKLVKFQSYANLISDLIQHQNPEKSIVLDPLLPLEKKIALIYQKLRDT